MTMTEFNHFPLNVKVQPKGGALISNYDFFISPTKGFLLASPLLLEWILPFILMRIKKLTGTLLITTGVWSLKPAVKIYWKKWRQKNNQDHLYSGWRNHTICTTGIIKLGNCKNSSWMLLLTIIFCVAIALLLHHAIEKPYMKMGEKFLTPIEILHGKMKVPYVAAKGN